MRPAWPNARIVLAVALLVGAGQIAAQNLLVNPDFDTNTSGWTATPFPAGSQTSLIWDGSDGKPAAGSAFLWAFDPSASNDLSLWQCVPAQAGRRYGLRAYRRMAGNQGVTGSTNFQGYFYGNSTCTDAHLSTFGSLTLGHTNGFWAATPRVSAVAPAGTQAAALLFRLHKDAGGGLGESADHLFLGRTVKGDFDGFGETDLVLKQLGDPGHHVVWLMNGVALNYLAPITPDAPGPEWQLVGTDDFNDDGLQDLVFWGAASGQVEFWLMDSSGTNRSGAAQPLQGVSPLATSWAVAATADFNHDGKPDLLWRNSQSQQLMVWTMNGISKLGQLTPTPSQAIDPNWAVVAALDWNGDGNTDLLWYNSTSGKIVLWFMDANVARITGQFTVPPNAGNNNWKVVAAGDYGVGAGGLPGTNDIVWRNASSGNMVVWYMDKAGNRTSGVFTVPAAPVDPLGWAVVGPK